MNTNKHKLVFTLAFFICLLQHHLMFSQDSTAYKRDLMGDWISYYDNRQDTVVYIPYNSPLAKNVSPGRRYEWITFNADNIYQQHLWKMCGNDDRPDFYPGSWHLRKINNDYVLTMVDAYKEIKEYVIVELSKDEIVLVPTP